MIGCRSRRQFLTLIMSGLLSGCGVRANTPDASSGTGPIVALNYAIAQTLLALGVDTFGMVSRRAYPKIVGEPLLPTSVFDIGVSSPVK